MNIISICLSTHRLETLPFSARFMHVHDVIALEEPAHAEFSHVLDGTTAIDEHLPELDIEYPLFVSRQYRMLRSLHQSGKEILQVEPYLDQLLALQWFLADGNTPQDLVPNTEQHAIYLAERTATGRLIDYYRATRTADFNHILQTMNDFAKADAARFILRDTMRAKALAKLLQPGKKIYVEAGSIHLHLIRHLSRILPSSWQLRIYSIDRQILEKLGHHNGMLFSPGDQLTIAYLRAEQVAKERWQLFCARAFIYAKLIGKEEELQSDSRYPHTQNEFDTIRLVNNLSLQQCYDFFRDTRLLAADEAARLILDRTSDHRPSLRLQAVRSS